MLDASLDMSLRSMTAVKIATVLWETCNFKALRLFTNLEELSIDWRQAELDLVDKASRLSLAVPLERLVVSVIRPVGHEIYTWWKYHCRIMGQSKDRKIYFSWTPYGTINWKIMARWLLNDADLNIYMQYLLACDYCFEDVIADRFKVLTAVKLSEISLYQQRFIAHPDSILTKQWTDRLIDEASAASLRNGKSFYQYCFERATCHNKVATEYLYQKLTEIEKSQSIIDVTLQLLKPVGFRPEWRFLNHSITDHSAIVCYLLSVMSREEQLQVAQNQPASVLKCFLKWPWCRSEFWRMYSVLKPLFSENDTYDFLLHIVTNFKELFSFGHLYGCEVLSELFKSIWQREPVFDKIRFINKENRQALQQMFETYTLASRRLHFRSISEAECDESFYKEIFDAHPKESVIVFSKTFSDAKELVYSDNFQLLKVLIETCLTSTDDVVRRGDDFSHTMYVLDKNEWHTFLKLVKYILED